VVVAADAICQAELTATSAVNTASAHRTAGLTDRLRRTSTLTPFLAGWTRAVQARRPWKRNG
jgi:hypothetical protein